MFDGQLGDFLGFPGTGSMRCRRQRGKSTFHPLHVSLEDLYKGKTAKLQLSKTVMCMKCNGAGSKSGVTMRCNVCNGRGVKVTIRQLGPGMVQQMQSVCHDCHGEGEVISDKDRCRECAGKKVVQETKVLEVHVDKGMKHEQKITFSGEGDQLPDVEPGDVVIVLQQLDHNVFTREGNNLLMTKTIPLTEALCGLQFVVHHLDGRDLVVSSQLGEVIKPGMVKTILEEGFPQYRCPYEKGDLVIKFDVAFPPKNFTDLDHLQMLETLLGSRDPAETPTGDHVEEVNMMDYEDARHTDGDNRGEAYHSDDEDVNGRRAHGPAGVECATQ